MLLDALIHLTEYVLLARLILGVQVLITELLNHVVVICEFIEFMLAKRRAKVYDKGNGDRVEYVLVQIFAKFGHRFD